MPRARGSNLVSALAFETAYGVAPATGYIRVPLTSSGLGSEQGQIEDDTLGFGREPLAPGDDVVNNVGDLVVPVDVRAFGLWLKSQFGAPVTTQGVAATGFYLFSAQPVNNAILTVNGQAITFVTGTPTANQVKIGATLAETVANAVVALNTSLVAGVAAARYAASLDGLRVNITHQTIGTAGNAFTLVAGTTPASNATVSAATLTGGAATGPYNHVFTSGATVLPSWALELGSPDVPNYAMNFGGKTGSITLPLARSGNFNATISAICQDDSETTTTSAGTPTEYDFERFTFFTGQVESFGVPLAELTSGSVMMSNNIEAAEVIRRDGRIAGADPGKFGVMVELALLFSDTKMRDQAAASQALDLVVSWSTSAAKSLTVRVPRYKLPKKAKRSIQGPGGLSVTYAGRGYKDATAPRSCIVTLVNDVPSYA